MRSGACAVKRDFSVSLEEHQAQGTDPVAIAAATVRRRPAMWVGRLDARGIHTLLFSLVESGLAEAVAGSASWVSVTLHEDRTFSVTDDGSGISVEPVPHRDNIPGLTVLFTFLYALRVEPVLGCLEDGLGGQVSIANFLGLWLEVQVTWGGRKYAQRFNRGIPVSEIEDLGPATPGDVGTRVRWLPDPEIFPGVEYDRAAIVNRLRTLSFLVPGVRLAFTDERTGETQVFLSKHGLADFVELLNTGRQAFHPPVCVQHRSEDLHLALALQYHDGMGTQILSFANHRNTNFGGAHEAALNKALLRVWEEHFRQGAILLGSRTRPSLKDALKGLCAVLAVRLRAPQFEGMTRDGSATTIGCRKWLP